MASAESGAIISMDSVAFVATGSVDDSGWEQKGSEDCHLAKLANTIYTDCLV